MKLLENKIKSEIKKSKSEQEINKPQNILKKINKHPVPPPKFISNRLWYIRFYTDPVCWSAFSDKFDYHFYSLLLAY